MTSALYISPMRPHPVPAACTDCCCNQHCQKPRPTPSHPGTDPCCTSQGCPWPHLRHRNNNKGPYCYCSFPPQLCCSMPNAVPPHHLPPPSNVCACPDVCYRTCHTAVTVHCGSPAAVSQESPARCDRQAPQWASSHPPAASGTPSYPSGCPQGWFACSCRQQHWPQRSPGGPPGPWAAPPG